ncbi:MAG: HAD hydrolase family protein [Candidatus Bathyarchaeota archaeon]|nr:HAD hydrolase family protein [Candidatus Bathyarchaeota archaeon]
MKHVFVSDCEGPISKNDNAFELTAQFVPKGDKLFSVISRYDDVLADVLKKPVYNAGDTLKLVLPFLRAFDVSDEMMQEFSAKTLRLILGSKETLQHIQCLSEAFIVSTSYEHYIKALCKCVELPFENTYCTKLSMNNYHVPQHEKTTLKTLAKEIAAMPLPTIPNGAKSIEDFSGQDQTNLSRLDQIFWEEIASMSCGEIVSEVTAVGGDQKAQAICDVVTRLGVAFSGVMYVGDSITDVQALQLVRENGGLAVSFNGNGYAVENAQVAVQSESSVVTAVLADVFLKHGTEQALDLAANWNRETLENCIADPTTTKQLFRLYPEALPKVQIVTEENMSQLSFESNAFRKKVRGEAVGMLG